MQVTTALLFALATVVSTTQVHAANCTTSERNGVQSLPEFQAYQAACSTVVRAKTAEADALPNVLCNDRACLASMAALSTALPRCEHAGTQLSAVFEETVRAYNNAVGNATDAPSSSPKPVALTTTSSAASVSALMAAATGLATVAVITLS